LIKTLSEDFPVIKNLIVGATLIALYQFLKKDWTDTDLYKVGLVDNKGNPIKVAKPTQAQQDANTRFAQFAASVKRILENYPILRIQILGAILNSIMMRESFDYRFVQDENGVGIVNNRLTEGKSAVFYEQHSSMLTEDEVANSVANIDTTPTKAQIIGKLLRRRNSIKGNDIIQTASVKIHRRNMRRKALAAKTSVED
jgi:hypothetical protein